MSKDLEQVEVKTENLSNENDCELSGKNSKQMKTEEQKEKSNTAHYAFLIIMFIVILVLLPIMIINLVIATKSIIEPTKAPSIFGITPLLIQSDSMESEIKSGQLIFVENIDYMQLKEGDIIAYYYDNKIITHRIIDIEFKETERLYQTRGDNNNYIDDYWVSQYDVIGIYRGNFLVLGEFCKFMHTPWGIVIFVNLIVICIVLFEVIRQRKMVNELVQKKVDEYIKVKNEEDETTPRIIIINDKKNKFVKKDKN